MANSVDSFALFVFRNDIKNGREEIVKQLNDKLEFAEDLVVDCAVELNITPVCRHLFAIYEKKENIWISPNEKLNALRLKSAVYELRVRFKPFDFNHLHAIDKNAFNYYFSQIRYDFLNAELDTLRTQRSQVNGIIFGVVIADIVRYSLEKNIARENVLDTINWSDFLPSKFQFAQKMKPFKYLKPLKYMTKIKNSIETAWVCSQERPHFASKEFMETVAFRRSTDSEPLLTDYGIEKYKAQKLFETTSNKQVAAIDVEVQCRPYGVCGISISHCNDPETRTDICSIGDLCFVSIQKATNTVEISRQNGTPVYLHFDNQMHLKSFVSCLDGLYRLTEKWSVNICKEITSPSLNVLHSLKCHGPVNYNFAFSKLHEKGGNNPGTYILRESAHFYNEFLLDVIVKQNDTGNIDESDVKTLKIEKISDDSFIVDNTDIAFKSIGELLKMIKVEVDQKSLKLTNCLRPSEFDKHTVLLLCRSNRLVANDRKLDWPLIIPNGYLEIHAVWKCNDSFEVGFATVKNESVVAKAVKSESFSHNFLQTVSEWSRVKCDSIIAIKGVSLSSPLALVVEFLPDGPLDAFLSKHRPPNSSIKTVDLIEAISCAARALWYLEEVNLVHGRIRCHNLLVAKYDENNLKVKLSDPISGGFNHSEKGNAWIAPEDASDMKTSATDVWAFGTTVWEVFSYGSKPNFENVSDLHQPDGCPHEIWTLVNECWIIDADQRKQPRSIVRDVNQILYEVHNSRRSNTYECVIETKHPSKNILKNLFYPKSFNSMSTLPVGNSTSTTLPYSVNSDVTSVDRPEPWKIQFNHLEFKNVLGTGYYGVVQRATLFRWRDLSQWTQEEEVAVKQLYHLDSKEKLLDMDREINIMKKLNHKNIVEIKGFVEDPQLMLVMEYLEYGSLVSYLKQKICENLKETVPLIKFALDIAEGMEYLEQQSIVHRDLAARNILVASPTDVKISDFGLAQIIKGSDYYKLKTNRGLPFKWYAPESLRIFPEGGKFSHKSDVWSYGVTLWQLYSYGADPCYYEDTPDAGTLLDLLESGVRLSRPNDCPLEVYGIMKKCWNNEENKRPNFTKIRKMLEELKKSWNELSK